jgi:valyl-tRNA synthetase
MGDVPSGVVCGRGTPHEFVAPGLAQAAIDAAHSEWRSSTGRHVSFHPDPVRYGTTYMQWLAEKRDWCISRQLWWGHRIPIWAGTFRQGAPLRQLLASLKPYLGREDVFAWATWPDGDSQALDAAGFRAFDLLANLDLIPPEDAGLDPSEEVEILVCLRDIDTDAELESTLEDLGLVHDPDVLDTWFSSGVWPHSTLGWPDPETAQIDAGQQPLGRQNGQPDCLDYYYPGSCLVTGRDIITLWVARMVLMGLYNLGDVPFTDVFVHANILDGKGERMSKSKGNGIDPVDIIEQYGADAMRYVLCDMQTGMQDIRLPVQAVSPFTGNLIDLATASHGNSIFTYLCPESGQEFDVLGTMPDVPSAKLVSDRFEIGRNFCNKLLNAVRFAMLNLQGVAFTPRQLQDLADEDRWILSRLTHATTLVQRSLEDYNPSAALGAGRDFFWSELCDWYLEFIKPRMRDPERAPLAQQVLAVAIDQVLRLLHPFVPFLTERLWQALVEQAPLRGIDAELPTCERLIRAVWPQANAAWRDEKMEQHIAFLQDLIRGIRDVRSRYTIPPQARVTARIPASGETAAALRTGTELLKTMAGLESIEIGADIQRSPDAATAVVGTLEVYIPGVIDPARERLRLARQQQELQKRIDGSRRKLGNEKFLSKANPDVVQKERDRLAESEAQMENVEAALATLS